MGRLYSLPRGKARRVTALPLRRQEVMGLPRQQVVMERLKPADMERLRQRADMESPRPADMGRLRQRVDTEHRQQAVIGLLHPEDTESNREACNTGGAV
jgi:hypothetical protein